jgi:hypothetical protein
VADVAMVCVGAAVAVVISYMRRLSIFNIVALQ